MIACPEIKQKQLQDRKAIFETLSLPVAKILSRERRQLSAWEPPPPQFQKRKPLLEWKGHSQSNSSNWGDSRTCTGDWRPRPAKTGPRKYALGWRKSRFQIAAGFAPFQVQTSLGLTPFRDLPFSAHSLVQAVLSKCKWQVQFALQRCKWQGQSAPGMVQLQVQFEPGMVQINVQTKVGRGAICTGRSGSICKSTLSLKCNHHTFSKPANPQRTKIAKPQSLAISALTEPNRQKSRRKKGFRGQKSQLEIANR